MITPSIGPSTPSIGSPPVASPGTGTNSPAEITAAAQKFEAIFIRQMLSAARASDFGGDDLFGGPGLEQFNAMRDENLADIASRTGAFGFAKLIETQLAAQMQKGT